MCVIYLLMIGTFVEEGTCMAFVWMSNQINTPRTTNQIEKRHMRKEQRALWTVLHPSSKRTVPVLRPCWPAAQCHLDWRSRKWLPGLWDDYYSLGVSLVCVLKSFIHIYSTFITKAIWMQNTVQPHCFITMTHLQRNIVQLHQGWAFACHRKCAPLLMCSDLRTFCVTS